MDLFQKHVIEGQRAGPKLLITGGVHGDEFEPMMAVRRMIREFKRDELRGILTLIPVVNESAFCEKHRFGEDGLDLARTFPGKKDGSITERVAAALSDTIRQSDYYIDLHTGGTTMSVSPMTGYMLHPDRHVLEKQRLMARAFNLPVIWGTSPRLEGRSMSVARDASVPAIYCEYVGSAVCHSAGVDAYVAGCRNVMRQLGMTDGELEPSEISHFVEDPRPDSGHMQAQNPAPLAGFFEPHVQLGESVRQGDLLGTVCNELGEYVHEVRSKQAGIVLTLRTFPRVDEGEGLAVILEQPSN